MNTREAQTLLISEGYDLGPSGADGIVGRLTRAALEQYQRKHGLGITGILDAATLSQMERRPDAQEWKPLLVPLSWMPRCSILRVIVHWTAGQHRASSSDREHYHALVEGDGSLVRGTPTIDKNDASGIKTGYAAHTLNCNTGSAGVSMCCMAQAEESPFSPGPAPMTEVQWIAMTRVVADLCRWYGIPITDRTVLTHAEVQPNLGITQRGKWDVTRLPFNSRVVGHRAVGDLLRQQVAALM